MSKKHFRALLAGAVLTALLAVILNQSFAAAKDKAKNDTKDKNADNPAAVSKEDSSKEDTAKDKNISLPVYAPSAYWLGVRVVPVPEILLSHFGAKEDDASLAVVENVVEKSPADKAGIKRGDVIIQFGDKSINTLEDLVEQVAKVKNTPQKMIIYRNGKKTELSATPEERPKEQFAYEEGAMPLPFRGQFPPGQFPKGRLPKGMPQPNWERVPGMHLGPEIWMGQKNPREMMKEMEEYFRQMQGGNDADQFTLVPEDEDGAESDTVESGTAKQLQVSTITDKDGKTKVKVRQVIRNGSNVQERNWETDSLEELPEEIQDEVKGLMGK